MKATLSNGTVLEGSPEEVAAAILNIGSFENDKNQSNSHPSAISNKRAVVWTEERARAFWNWLYGNQKKFVELLIERNGKANIDEVKKRLGLKKGAEVAGLRSCITRNARRETKYDEADVITWERGADGHWYYRLVPEVHELLKRVS